MAKRTPEELWDELVDEAGEDEIERIEKMSEAEIDAELAKAGVDVGAANARADAFLDALERGEMPAERSGPRERKPERKKPRGVPVRVVWIAAMTATAAAAAGSIVFVSNLAQVASPAPAPDLPAAADLRARAKAALDAGRAQECLSLLDEAKAKDPDGDAAPEVRQLRDRAERALRPQKP